MAVKCPLLKNELIIDLYPYFLPLDLNMWAVDNVYILVIALLFNTLLQFSLMLKKN